MYIHISQQWRLHRKYILWYSVHFGIPRVPCLRLLPILTHTLYLMHIIWENTCKKRRTKTLLNSTRTTITLFIRIRAGIMCHNPSTWSKCHVSTCGMRGVFRIAVPGNYSNHLKSTPSHLRIRVSHHLLKCFNFNAIWQIITKLDHLPKLCGEHLETYEITT